MMTASVSVGQKISSLDELNSTLKLWEEHTCVTLYTRSSRTVAATRKHAPKHHINDDLEYSELNYACVTWWSTICVTVQGKKGVPEV